ncbi:unnamed protein product [Dimorphilus gyrociliatus]|uniref:Uncharacterized protein n=1 Tax=Dimorphilus gyrociliatus TaxID=2664684 RepID=A0A7I8W3V5_9ANNE|nr:unnamed protein product [Dimorphilus gyrociliatus]
MATSVNFITYSNVTNKLTELAKDTLTWKIVTGGGLLLVGGYYIFLKDRNSLPGPRGFPFLGITPWLDKETPHLNLIDYTKEYGDVCKIPIMLNDIIFVSGEKNIYDMYINKQDDFSNRLHSVRFKALKNGFQDLTFMNDHQLFRDSKKMTLRSLKTYSEGMKKVEDISSEIIGEFLEYIQSTQSKPVDISNRLKVLFGSIITSMTLNRRIENSVMEKFVAAYDEILIILQSPSTAILEVFPWLRSCGNKSYKKLVNCAKRRDNLIEPIVREAIDNFDPHDIKTTTDQLWHYMNQSNIDYDFKDLYGISYNLIVAGFITTSSTLYGLFPILMSHRHIEQKILQEIEHNIGFNRLPSLDDKANMPYTEATILEAHRYLSVVPFSLPHIAVRDSTIGGYNIKKGSQIWPNIWGLHHDETIWGDPENFRPERFLDDNGRVLTAEHRFRKW